MLKFETGVKNVHEEIIDSLLKKKHVHGMQQHMEIYFSGHIQQLLLCLVSLSIKGQIVITMDSEISC